MEPVQLGDADDRRRHPTPHPRSDDHRHEVRRAAERRPPDRLRLPGHRSIVVRHDKLRRRVADRDVRPVGGGVRRQVDRHSAVQPRRRRVHVQSEHRVTVHDHPHRVRRARHGVGAGRRLRLVDDLRPAEDHHPVAGAPLLQSALHQHKRPI